MSIIEQALQKVTDLQGKYKENQKLIADVLRKHTGLCITATELFSKDGAQPAKP